MSYETAVYNVLSFDSALNTLLGGRIYAKSAIPGRDYNRHSLPDAFGANGGVKDSLVVVGGTLNNTYSLREPEYISVTQFVDLWFYADRDSGYSVIRSAANRAFVLLNEQTIVGGFLITFVSEFEGRDANLGSASFLRSEYRVTGYRST